MRDRRFESLSARGAIGAALSLVLLLSAARPISSEEKHPMPGDRLTAAQATALGRLALSGIVREYPNKPSNVMATEADVRSPRAMHPAFYGCFDWHSSVHGHWMLARLLRLYPEVPAAKAWEARLEDSLTEDKLRGEAAYFAEPHNRAFERTYGWAWLLRLAQELRTWDDSRATRWARHLRPLEAIIVKRMLAFLPKPHWPIRAGTHTDGAFALAFALDYARAVGHAELEALCLQRAADWYGDDRDYPAAYEPSGFDFFSAGLNEADLMRRVLAPAAFSRWLTTFLPGLAQGAAGNLLTPAEVPDASDGHMVHLAGLNLTRAWTLRGIERALRRDDPRRRVLAASVRAHTQAGMAYVFSGHYEGEHWLASFAVYLLSDAGTPQGATSPPR